MIPDELWLQHYNSAGAGPVAAGADAVTGAASPKADGLSGWMDHYKQPSFGAPEYQQKDLSVPFAGSGLSAGTIGASDPVSNTVGVGGPSMSDRIGGGLMNMGRGLMGNQTPGGLSTPGIASPYQMSDRRAKRDVRPAAEKIRDFLDEVWGGR